MKHEASIGINTPNSHNDTEDTYLFHELSAHVASLVDQLPGRCQQVYKLNIEEGFSYREVAEEMDISVHTVKEHLTRARNFLTSNLRKQYRETLQL